MRLETVAGQNLLFEMAREKQNISNVAAWAVSIVNEYPGMLDLDTLTAQLHSRAPEDIDKELYSAGIREAESTGLILEETGVFYPRKREE